MISHDASSQNAEAIAGERESPRSDERPPMSPAVLPMSQFQTNDFDDDPNPSSPQRPSSSKRELSTSKRAEQNRKAQRAFRERRDQHVKHLESRSQLLDQALASADEANRRWEECRTLIDQLRVEITTLRQENESLKSALNNTQTLSPDTLVSMSAPAQRADSPDSSSSSASDA